MAHSRSAKMLLSRRQFEGKRKTPSEQRRVAQVEVPQRVDRPRHPVPHDRDTGIVRESCVLGHSRAAGGGQGRLSEQVTNGLRGSAAGLNVLAMARQAKVICSRLISSIAGDHLTKTDALELFGYLTLPSAEIATQHERMVRPVYLRGRSYVVVHSPRMGP